MVKCIDLEIPADGATNTTAEMYHDVCTEKYFILYFSPHISLIKIDFPNSSEINNRTVTNTRDRMYAVHSGNATLLYVSKALNLVLSFN